MVSDRLSLVSTPTRGQNHGDYKYLSSSGVFVSDMSKLCFVKYRFLCIQCLCFVVLQAWVCVGHTIDASIQLHGAGGVFFLLSGSAETGPSEGPQTVPGHLSEVSCTLNNKKKDILKVADRATAQKLKH